MTSYQPDKFWSDLYIPEIKRIVGAHLLDVATVQQDQSEAADLVTLITKSVAIACRVRRDGYAERYGEQFTIRAARDTGAKTELEKILDEGKGDWFFYAMASKDNMIFSVWHLLDLSAFRIHLKNGKSNVPYVQKDNHDGTYFNAYWIAEFPKKPPLLIDSSNRELLARVSGRT